MSTSVVESVDGTSGTLGTTPSVTIATTPSAGDILVVVLQHSSTIGATSISGCGATWTTLQATDASATLDHHIFIGTGATSSGTISLTTTTSRAGLVRALVVRGANSTTVTATTVMHSINGGASTTSDTVTASPNQAVICVMGSGNTNNVLFSATTPSSGWTLDTANGTFILQAGIRNAASSSESHNCSASCTTGTAHQFRFTMLTVGSADGGSVSGTASAPMGGLSASASGVRSALGTAAAVLGLLAASATGTRTHATTATAPLGAVTSAATSVRTHPATATAPLDALTSTASSLRTTTGSAAAPLGPLTSAAISVTPVNGTAAAPLGGLASSGSGRRTVLGTVAAPLGSVTSTAISIRTVSGSAAAGLGVLAAAATGHTSRSGTATAPLGPLTGSATGPSHTGTAHAPLGVLTAAAREIGEGPVKRIGDPYITETINPSLPQILGYDVGDLVTITVAVTTTYPNTLHFGIFDDTGWDVIQSGWYDHPSGVGQGSVGVYVFTDVITGPRTTTPQVLFGGDIVHMVTILERWKGLTPVAAAYGSDTAHSEFSTAGTVTSSGLAITADSWVFSAVAERSSTTGSAVDFIRPTAPDAAYYSANGLSLATGTRRVSATGTAYTGAHFTIPGTKPLLAMVDGAWLVKPATAAAPLGGLNSAATGVHTRRSTATAPLGRLIAGPLNAALADAYLGELAAGARGKVTGVASAPLGALIGACQGFVPTFNPGGGILTVTTGSATFGATARIVLGSVGVDADGTDVSGVALNATSPWPSLALFDVLGRTKIGNLHPRGLTWRDPLSAAGVVKFDLPMDEDMSRQAGGKRIVKTYWKGKARMAARIEGHKTQLAVDDTVWRSFELAGALEMWNDGIVLPEYGLKRASSQSRTFGPMSRADNWGSRTPFTHAHGFRYNEDTGRRRGKPAGLKSLNPWWIALTDPYDSQPPNATQWFRKVFPTFSGFPWTMYAAADDLMTIWVDGEQVFSSDQANQQSFKYLAQIEGSFEAGPHVIAVEVVNGVWDNNHNPVAFIAAIQQNDASGDPVKGPPFMITSDRWFVTDTISEWHHAEVLLTMVEEMTRAEVRAFEVLRAGFSDTIDSVGEAWTDGGRPTIQIGQGLADVGTTFAETYFDLHVDPATMLVHAYKRLGGDRSATVKLDLGDVGNGGLISHEIDRREPGANSAIMQLADGRWTTREDAASVAAYGRAMIALSLGSTAATESADAVADSQFNETAHPTRSITSETHTLVGPQPYEHYFNGDSISVVDEDEDGYVKARVIAINVDASADDVVRAWPEVEEDRT